MLSRTLKLDLLLPAPVRRRRYVPDLDCRTPLVGDPETAQTGRASIAPEVRAEILELAYDHNSLKNEEDTEARRFSGVELGVEFQHVGCSLARPLMTIDEIRDALYKAGVSVKSEERLGNDTGTQLRLNNGAIVNCFDKGSYSIQGKNKQAVEQALGIAAPTAAAAAATVPSAKVFVVYGHDTTARDQLEAMLRRWGLDPIILDQLPSEGTTLIEKLENYYQNVGFGVVLATPDDVGHPKNKEDQKAFRARQNVVLELGMLLAHLGRKRVAILLKDQETMERPSDIQGLIYIPFKSDIAKEAGLILAKEMSAQGYRIDVAKI